MSFGGYSNGTNDIHPSVDWATTPGHVDFIELGDEQREANHRGDDGSVQNKLATGFSTCFDMRGMSEDVRGTNAEQTQKSGLLLSR